MCIRSLCEPHNYAHTHSLSLHLKHNHEYIHKHALPLSLPLFISLFHTQTCGKHHRKRQKQTLKNPRWTLNPCPTPPPPPKKTPTTTTTKMKQQQTNKQITTTTTKSIYYWQKKRKKTEKQRQPDRDDEHTASPSPFKKMAFSGRIIIITKCLQSTNLKHKSRARHAVQN